MASLKRVLREIRLDANPLRRTCDRVETWIVIALCVTFLVGAPVTAILAGSYVYRAGIRAERASHQVTAVLLAGARALYGGSPRASAPATWTDQAGTVGWGRVHVPAGTRAGVAIRAWVDGSGRLVDAPLRGDGLARAAAGAAVSAPAALATLLAGTAMIARWMLWRRRSMAWEAAWRSTEPWWSRRGRR